MDTRFTGASATRLRERLRDETSARILEAAEAVISEDGLGAARIERIAGRAGVSVGTIYNHFDDRNALLEALFDTRGGRMVERLEQSVGADPNRTATEQVRGLLEALVDHGREHRALFGALAREGHGPAQLRAPPISRAALAVSAAVIVERGIARGEFRPDPHGVYMDALIGLARQALACAVEGRGTPEEIEALTGLFVRGVAP